MLFVQLAASWDSWRRNGGRGLGWQSLEYRPRRRPTVRYCERTPSRQHRRRSDLRGVGCLCLCFAQPEPGSWLNFLWRRNAELSLDKFTREHIVCLVLDKKLKVQDWNRDFQTFKSRSADNTKNSWRVYVKQVQEQKQEDFRLCSSEELRSVTEIEEDLVGQFYLPRVSQGGDWRIEPEVEGKPNRDWARLGCRQAR